MKVLKSMLFVATLMLLSISCVFSQSGVIDVMPKVTTASEVNVLNVFIGEDHITTMEFTTPLRTRYFPLKLKVKNNVGMVIYSTEITGTDVVLPDWMRGILRLEVWQSRLVIMDKDVKI